MERTPEPSNLLAVDDAIATAINEARALVRRHPRGIERRALWEARGMVLAADALTDRDMPPFSRSAMDGWALRAADVTGREATLRIVGEVAAGSSFHRPLQPGETVAIMTGAPIPDGADAVQMVEQSTRLADAPDQVQIGGPVTAGQHIRHRGEDLHAGAVAVGSGRVLDGLTCGVLASVGMSDVHIYRRPRVAVIATGNELVDISETPGPAQIRESNRHTLFGMLGDGCRTVDGGRVEDTEQALRLALRDGLDNDVLVLSGGVSAGVYDLVADALVSEGCEIVFHKVRMKPGKPVLMARHDAGLVFGLPGNPVSTFVTAQVLLLPALRVLAGRREPGPWSLTATLEGGLPRTKGRVTFESGYLTQRAGRWQVRSVAFNGSGDQVGFATGNCLIRREAGSERAETGAAVQVILPRPPVRF